MSQAENVEVKERKGNLRECAVCADGTFERRLPIRYCGRGDPHLKNEEPILKVDIRVCGAGECSSHNGEADTSQRCQDQPTLLLHCSFKRIQDEFVTTHVGDGLHSAHQRFDGTRSRLVDHSSTQILSP